LAQHQPAADALMHAAEESDTSVSYAIV